MRLLLLILLLISPAWSAPREWQLKATHRKALLGLGLPLYTLPEASGVTYRNATIQFAPDSKYYKLEYWSPGDQDTKQHFVYCSQKRYALPPVGKPLESQQILAGKLGSLTVTRYKKVCRTGWLKLRGAWVQVESESDNLARFGQLLEQFAVTPGRARRSARADAIRLTGLDNYEVPGLPIKLTTIEYDPFRNWNSYVVSYSAGGSTLTEDVTQGGIGDVSVGFQRSQREQKVQVGKLNFLVCLARTSTAKDPALMCYTEWAKLPKGYLHLRSESSDYGRFLGWVKQLRRIP